MAGPERDVILSAFATGDAPPGFFRIGEQDMGSLTPVYSQPLDAFEQEPLLVVVPPRIKEGEGTAAPGFARTANKYTDPSDGSVLRRFLRAFVKDVTIRRLCLVGFSAGGTFVSKVLKTPDAQYVDSVIMLDALHLQKKDPVTFRPLSIDPWIAFSERCARGADAPLGHDPSLFGPMCIHSHTQIATPHHTVGSTAESTAAVMDAVFRRLGVGVSPFPEIPFELVAAPPPPTIRIKAGNPRSTKVWDAPIVPQALGTGGLWALDYGGRTGPDHALQPWVLQRKIFEAFLAPRWNIGLGRACRISGLYDDEPASCGPRGVIVPPGVYSAGSNAWLVGAVAALAGAAAGWGASRFLW